MKIPLKPFGWLMCFFVIQCLIGCNNASNNQEKIAEMNTDIIALKRFVKLPADVESCEWQTGEFAPGGDWWLAAVLSVKAEDLSKFLPEPSNQELVEIPPTLKLNSSFAVLKSFPSANVVGSDRTSFITEVYPVTPYENSPLLNGKTIKLSDRVVFILLWTL